MALGKWTKLTAFVGIPSLSVATYYYSTLSKTTPKQALAALNSKEFKAFTLKEILPVNHNTAIFRFQLPGEATELGLPTTSCIVTRFQDGTKEDGSPNFVIRPYTPVEDSGLKSKGLFDLIIKKYPNGPMSSHIFKLIPGQTLEMKGPIPKFPYTPNEFSRIGLIAGGTGGFTFDCLTY